MHHESDTKLTINSIALQYHMPLNNLKRGSSFAVFDNGFYSDTVMLLLFTRPLPSDGGMADDHGAPEAEQLPRVWTKGRKEIESPKSERRKQSVAGQCRMR